MVVSRVLFCLFFTITSLGLAKGQSGDQEKKPDHVRNEILIRFSDDLSDQEKKQKIEMISAEIVHPLLSGKAYLVRLKASDQDDAFLSAMNLLQSDQDVKYVGPNRIFSLLITPNDPSIGRQDHLETIAAKDAWEIQTGSKDVVIGVIDTGIYYEHPDLAENMWVNPGESGLDDKGQDKKTNGIDDDGNGYIDDVHGWNFVNENNDPSDDHGHGTHCAGSIGAVSNNEIGISGLNWQVKLAALRFIGANGSGTEANAIRAIEYATKMGFDITSNSWGGTSTTGPKADLLCEAIAEAIKQGSVFVAAAGNSAGDSDKRPIFPAAMDLPGIVSVAASTSKDSLASFSNYGAESVDLMAPGVGIFSTGKPGIFGRHYTRMSGTSMAAPIVAGALGLLKAEFPSATPEELKEKLLNSVDQVPAAEGKMVSNGRLNVYRALTE